jgi:hypothetical protein
LDSFFEKGYITPHGYTGWRWKFIQLAANGSFRVADDSDVSSTSMITRGVSLSRSG